nr:MAG TPA: Glycine rich protein family [Caudoviricetes sp.]
MKTKKLVLVCLASVLLILTIGAVCIVLKPQKLSNNIDNEVTEVNSLKKEFEKEDCIEVAEKIYVKFRDEGIYCYSLEKNVVYFNYYGAKDKSYIDVELPTKIIIHNPDPDYLKMYFNSLVPLWDNNNAGYEIINDLRKTTYENENGYWYNRITRNDVVYQVKYNLKNKNKIDDVYIIFADESE